MMATLGGLGPPWPHMVMGLSGEDMIVGIFGFFNSSSCRQCFFFFRSEDEVPIGELSGLAQCEG